MTGSLLRLLRRDWPWLRGFAMGVFPPVGVLLVAGAALPRVLRVESGERLIMATLAALALERAWLGLRGGDAPVLGAAGALLGWVLFKSSIMRGGPRLVHGLAVGIVLTSVAAAFEVLNDPGWVVQQSRNQGGRLYGRERLVSLSAANPYAYRSLGASGVGPVRVQFQMRSDRPAVVRVSINHPALPQGGRASLLSVNESWAPYELNASTPAAGTLVLAVGGEGGWPAGLGLEFRALMVSGPRGMRNAQGVQHRASGWAFNPNALGLGTVVLAAAVAGAPASPLVRASAAIAGIVTAGLSGSRGALGAALVALIVAIGLSPLRRERRWQVLSTVVAVAVLAASRPDLVGRFGTTFDPQAETTVQRLALYEVAVAAFASSPLVGVGPLGPFITDALDRDGERIGLRAGETRHVHSLWLQTAAESGVVGLSILLLVWVAAVRRVFARRDAAAAAVLSAVAFGVTFDYLWYFAPVYAAFWMSIGGTAVTPAADSGRGQG